MRASAPAFGSTGSLLDWNWVLELFARSRNGWLASTRPDGRPHVAPLWVVTVEEQIWFSTPAATTKGRNLARDSRVVLHVETGDDVAIVDGSAVRDATVQGVIGAYAAKYGWADPDAETFWTIEVESALAWRGHLGSTQIDATRFSGVG